MNKIILYLKSKFFKQLSIDEVTYLTPDITRKIRNEFKILFIDDRELSIIDTLKNEYGFDIKYKKEKLDNIYDASIYDIILCDLQGVHTDSPLEGASLIKNLRVMYPNKQLILYTSGNLSNEQLEVINEYADKRIKKGQDKETWERILDDCILEIVDPKKAWEKMKKYLERKDVKTKDIARFEDIFVRTYRSENLSNFKQIANIFEFYNLADEYERIIIPIIKLVIKFKVR